MAYTFERAFDDPCDLGETGIALSRESFTKDEAAARINDYYKDSDNPLNLMPDDLVEAKARYQVWIDEDGERCHGWGVDYGTRKGQKKIWLYPDTY